MVSRTGRYALLLLPLLVAAACGGPTDDRSALEQDELSRELDLALQGDTAVTHLQDTPVTTAPEPQPAPPQQRPAPARPRPTPPPVQTPPDPTPPAPPVRVEPEPPTPVRLTVGVGTTMALTLDQQLSTETNQANDVFFATLAQPVRGDAGEIVIPAGAKVRGRVTQVQKSGRVGETAVLNLAFEAVTFGGESYPLEASVVKANPERVGRASTGENAGKVAAGAAAGAILGRILGGSTKDAIKGAVVGAAAGTAIVMGTADVDAVLKEGSEMMIKVDAPIVITTH
jgi:hypothetical protein